MTIIDPTTDSMTQRPGESTPADPREPVPPVVCKPWCVHDDGHPGEIALEDQWCGTAERAIALTLYPDVDQGDDTTGPEELRIYGIKRPDETPFIQVSIGGEDTLQLTLDEAQRLTTALILVAAEVSQVTFR